MGPAGSKKAGLNMRGFEYVILIVPPAVLLASLSCFSKAHVAVYFEALQGGLYLTASTATIRELSIMSNP
ncbi:hypothetical protein NEOLEDRAFT_297576 [Neolentinus lepideus HHB14362 ss-1]|uniref:Uncharacterized protein n=1 Tax=Neolentinus lepideus HHB14362 ss-1 TaxID=1314782 RepID=A0A165VPP8_9AGAM|nr:hypothetical protein NEOLEDRAFT_297576 [Neolentinus lepideus HHB14362 ss-1]